MTKLLFFVFIFLGCLNSFACSIVPSNYYVDPVTQVKNAKGIYSIRNIGYEVKKGKVYFYFSVIESIKGSMKKTITLSYDIEPYNISQININDKGRALEQHLDYRFWLYNWDRTGMYSDCNIYPSFRKDSVYLYFNSDSLTFRSFEEISNNDYWYQFVRKAVNSKSNLYPILTYRSFLDNFEKVYKFKCPSLSKSERFTSYDSMLKGQYKELSVSIPRFNNGSTCVGTGLDFVVFVDTKGRKIIAPIQNNYVDFNGIFDFELIFENKFPLIEFQKIKGKRREVE